MTRYSRELKRRSYTINKTEEGYIVNRPVYRGLVLSGGGAKATAYAGMIEAMHERGFIEPLTHVCGSSAGAMAASLLAIGMEHGNISTIITKLNMMACLDNNGMRVRAKGDRVRNILEVIYMYQIKEHIKDLALDGTYNYDLLKLKIDMHESALETEKIRINSIDDIIKLSDSSQEFKKLDKIFKLMKKSIKNNNDEKLNSLRINFADLARLRTILPDDKKHLIKQLYVLTTNQTQKISEIYNEDAEVSLAGKVQLSGAHPAIFSPKRNKRGDEIADGGILNNMPSNELEKAGLDREEILCVGLETDVYFEDRLNTAKKHHPEPLTGLHHSVDWVAEKVCGGSVLAGNAEVSNREKIFYHLGNMLLLNAGSITTITIAPSDEQKKIAVDNGFRQFNELLDSHQEVFKNPLIAMLYLGADKLELLMVPEDKDQELAQCAAQAQGIFLLQRTMVDELKDKMYDCIEDYIKQIEDILINEPQLDDIQKKQALALCLKQVDYASEGKLEKYIITQINNTNDAKKTPWYTELLALLRQAIDWIFSLFPCCDSRDDESPEEDGIKTNSPRKSPSRKISAASLHGMFFYKEDIASSKNDMEEKEPENASPEFGLV